MGVLQVVPELRSPAPLMTPVDDDSTWFLAQHCCPHTKQAGICSLENGRATFSTSSFRMGCKGEQEGGEGSWKEMSKTQKN